MKIKIIATILLALLGKPLSAGINEGSDLILYKQPLVEFYPRAEICDGLFRVDLDKDVPDMRDFRYYFCQGRYTVILYGPPGTTVTLFGGFDFGTEFGYLVIKKLDHERVWLQDLVLHPDREWKRVEATSSTGAYEVYYQNEPSFDEKISSVKWGIWWNGVEPGDQIPGPPKKS